MRDRDESVAEAKSAGLCPKRPTANDTQRDVLAEEKQLKIIGKIIKVNGEGAVCLASTKIKCFLVRLLLASFSLAGTLVSVGLYGSVRGKTCDASLSARSRWSRVEGDRRPRCLGPEEGKKRPQSVDAIRNY